jgi:diguanylate cyclase (GGDEF)-like protein
LLLLLAATLAGTSICLISLWWIIRPLSQLAQAIKSYRANGTPVRMTVDRRDEIGLLATTVTAMVAETESLMTKLRHQAMTDPLTGLGNRRWLGERAAEELARAERYREPISVLVLDLDRFKGINDGHGHETGDRVLVATGEVIRTCLRPYDLASRIGGEEFCIMLPRTSADEAEVIGERLRVALASTTVAPLRRGRVTASFGLCIASPGDRLPDLLLRADFALYEAKRSGRNCIRRAIDSDTADIDDEDRHDLASARRQSSPAGPSLN